MFKTAQDRLDAMMASGSELRFSSNELYYNLALTHFEMEDYRSSVDYLDRILSSAYESYPQLTLPYSDLTTSDILRKTSLIEALNLKAAISFLQSQVEEA